MAIYLETQILNYQNRQLPDLHDGTPNHFGRLLIGDYTSLRCDLQLIRVP